MLAGLALFAVGLVVGGTAPNMPVLVAGRAVQGLGAGVVPAVAYVAISRCYPEECRPRMFAVLSTAWVVPGLIGPAVAALVAGSIVAAAAFGIGRGPGVALAFSFGIVVALTGVIVGAQLPGQLTGSTAGHPR
jgi:MFS family permease